MGLKTDAMKRLSKRRAKQLRRYITDPEGIQAEQLRQITRDLSYTEYGQQYGITHRVGRASYTNRVPLVRYEELAPYIERMMQGEKQILVREPIRWFAKSGGTTNAQSKYLPINTRHLHRCHYRGGMDTILIYLLNHPESRFFEYKSFALAGSYDHFSPNPLIRTGDLSAILLMRMPVLGRMLRVPDISIALHPEWETKLELITDAIMKEKIVSISGVPSWMLSVMKRLLEKSGQENIRQLWPELEVFFHGGIAFEPYHKEYQKVLGEGVHYQETYNASEGFFGIQDDPNDPALLLMLDYGVYYEFIPMEQYDDTRLAELTTLPLHEIELGKNYALVISTLGGTYRYLIGDTVSFTQKNPYKFIITGRTKSFINAFGEELMVTNADTVIARLNEELQCQLKEYTAGPVFLTTEGKGYHHWVMEWEVPPANMEEYRQRFDQLLQEVNSDYQAKRHHDFSLQAPRIDVVPPGTFYRWLQSHQKLGGQNKIIRLTKDDSMVREILAIATPSGSIKP